MRRFLLFAKYCYNKTLWYSDWLNHNFSLKSALNTTFTMNGWRKSLWNRYCYDLLLQSAKALVVAGISACRQTGLLHRQILPAVCLPPESRYLWWRCWYHVRALCATTRVSRSRLQAVPSDPYDEQQMPMSSRQWQPDSRKAATRLSQASPNLLRNCSWEALGERK